MPELEETRRDGPHDPQGRRAGLSRLGERLDAFEAGRASKPFLLGGTDSAGEGYRMLGQMLGGVLGCVGLGWLVDHFAHTGPWGLIGGLLIGVTLSVYGTVRLASRISARAAAKPGAAPPVRDDDEDD